MYISFKYLPISEVIALGFLGPIITILSSSFFLKEKINLTRMSAILFSIIGSTLILRPDKILLNYEYYNLIITLPLLSITKQLQAASNITEKPYAPESITLACFNSSI